VLVAVLATVLAIAPSASVAKKKKKRTGGALDVTRVVNATVPDANPTPPGAFSGAAGTLRSTIDAGKEFKGRRIRDVNVTVQTLGTAGTAPAGNLLAHLTAPNGATSQLFSALSGTFNFMTFTPNSNPSIGPLTLDDEARLLLGGGAPTNPILLYRPWAGTAEPDEPLAPMDDGPVQGTWTLTVLDLVNMETSNLVSWRLNVVAGRPYASK
jgi:hypothetical protein